jgi:hypothetical protein
MLHGGRDEATGIHKLLWEGGFLWKIPFNGKGLPERRIVSVKRASYQSIYSKAVRLIEVSLVFLI